MNNTFYGCTSLINIMMSDGVPVIGYQVFYGYNKLTNINYAGTKLE